MKKLEMIIEDLEQVAESIDIDKELDSKEVRELERVVDKIDIDKVLKDITI